LNHHLYDEDTQLFFSCYPQDLYLSTAALMIHIVASRI